MPYNAMVMAYSTCHMAASNLTLKYKYKYKYFEMVLEYYSSTSTSTKYYISASDHPWWRKDVTQV